MKHLDAIQQVVLVGFTSYSLLFAMVAILKRKASIIGTGGTVIAPALVLVLVVMLNIRFYFTGNTIAEIIGIALMVGGAFLTYWANKHLGTNKDDFWIAKDKTKKRKLITTGPYKFVRHPIYTAMFLLYTGLFFVFLHTITAALVGVYFLAVAYTTFREERFLRKQFPEYVEYMNKTGMFIPRF